MENMTQYGPWGIAVVAMAGFIMYLMKSHRDERNEWGKRNERQTDESNRITRENTNILSSLKTLLESRK